MTDEKPRKDHSLLIVIGNCVLAVSAWTLGAYLIMSDHPNAGGWLIAMPLLFNFRDNGE